MLIRLEGPARDLIMINIIKGPSRDFVANLPFQAAKASFWDFGMVDVYSYR